MKPNKIISSILIFLILFCSDTFMSFSAQSTVFTNMTVDSLVREDCVVSEVFKLNIYVKDVTSIKAISIPLLYDADKAILIDRNQKAVNPTTDKRNVLDINPNFELLENEFYPTYDTVNGFIKLVIISVDEGIILNPEELLCTITFKATNSGTFTHGFAKSGDVIFDETSQEGVTYYNNDNDEIPFFPIEKLTSFKIKDTNTEDFIKDLVNIIPNDIITVPYGTSQNNIPFPTTVSGNVYYRNQEFNDTNPSMVELFEVENWTTDSYSPHVSGVYNFTTPIKLPTDTNNPYHLEAKQSIFVAPPPLIGGGGLGPTTKPNPSPTLTPSPSPSPAPTGILEIQCLDAATDLMIYTQTITEIKIGTQQTVNAPKLEGYNLADTEEPSKIIEIEHDINTVEFMYTKDSIELNNTDHYKYILGYPDKTVQPNGNITREEVATIFYRLLDSETRSQYRTTQHTFDDVPTDSWSLTEISTMQKLNIIEGYGDSMFKPKGKITRAELTTIAMRFSNMQEGATHNFEDINMHWAQRYIASAFSKGIVDGYPDGTFMPDQPITRVETMKIINRLLGRKVDATGVMERIIINWSDNLPSHWGYYEVLEATISHTYMRQQEGEYLETWLDSANDVDFKE